MSLGRHIRRDGEDTRINWERVVAYTIIVVGPPILWFAVKWSVGLLAWWGPQ